MEVHSQMKCDNTENRKNICAGCGIKAMFGKNKTLNSNEITEKILELFRKYLNKNFDINNLI